MKRSTAFRSTAPEKRHQANRLGRRAEWVAAALLMLKGYRPLARNYTVRGGEIDLIARRGQTLAFVEVKARPLMDDALTAISPTKIKRIRCAARVWLARNPQAAGLILRGDGIFISPGRLPRHVENAYELDLL